MHQMGALSAEFGGAEGAFLPARVIADLVADHEMTTTRRLLQQLVSWWSMELRVVKRY